MQNEIIEKNLQIEEYQAAAEEMLSKRDLRPQPGHDMKQINELIEEFDQKFEEKDLQL